MHQGYSHATTMSLQLNCLIEGEDIVFPVTVVRDDEVSDLKEKIQSKRALASMKGQKPCNGIFSKFSARI